MIRDYFNSLADVLSARSKSASFSGHRPDTGTNREELLIEILNKHLPDRLRAIGGGKVLNLQGDLSRQIDVIVKNDLFPKFAEHDKSCVIAESVAGVIGVRSYLDKLGLEESIENVASVPGFSDKTLSMTNSSLVRVDLQAQFLAKWPFRAVFAYDSIDPDTIYKHALAYYQAHSSRVREFPDMIVVNKGICIRYLRDGGVLQDGTKLPANYLQPLLLKDTTQGYPIAGMITTLNDYVPWMHYMKFNFSPYIDSAYA
ncbi:MAG: hypothetical protein RKP20_08560 [Candidatus Competibacter sp.]|nr:hypothetical protein [Candidatus Competibacter sp.]